MWLAATLFAGASAVAGRSPSVMGKWLSASKGAAEVLIAPCADPAHGPLCGTIVGLINPKGPDGKDIAPRDATDIRNPEPNLRMRKVIGMLMMYDFKTVSDPNAFEEGTIYYGDNGKTYRAKIDLQPDAALRLHGYVGTPLFGEPQIWKRIQ